MLNSDYSHLWYKDIKCIRNFKIFDEKNLIGVDCSSHKKLKSPIFSWRLGFPSVDANYLNEIQSTSAVPPSRVTVIL